jgi:hypothetical protein
MKMKPLLMGALMMLSVSAWAGVPQWQTSLDVQYPNREWNLTVYAGATPLLRANLSTDGTAWTASSDWSGFMWYGTNTDWSATNTVKITGTVYTNQTYADFQATGATFSDEGMYYGGFVMTNATQMIEWGLGTVQVKTSGGIGSPGGLVLSGSAYGSHVSNTNNPHNTTATQLGVVGTNDAVYIASLTNGSATGIATFSKVGRNFTIDVPTSGVQSIVTAYGYLPYSGATGTLAMGSQNITSTGYVGKANGARVDFLNGKIWGPEGETLMNLATRTLCDVTGLEMLFWSATGATVGDTAAAMGANTLNALGGLYENSVALSAKYAPIGKVGYSYIPVLFDPNSVGSNTVLDLGHRDDSYTLTWVESQLQTTGCTSSITLLSRATNATWAAGPYTTNGIFTCTATFARSTTFSNAAVANTQVLGFRLDSYNPANSNSTYNIKYSW